MFCFLFCGMIEKRGKGFGKLKVQLASEIKAFENIHLDVLDTTTISKD